MKVAGPVPTPSDEQPLLIGCRFSRKIFGTAKVEVASNKPN
jgi:hypothetical protein